jgi:hypothetical protein
VRVATKADPLQGIKFGVNDRTLLLAAPAPHALGMVVRMPGGTRSDHAVLQRSARKLRDLGLLYHERMSEEVFTHDPRLERPLYGGGRFWLAEEPMRRRVVRRTVVWITPLGEGLRMIYQHELRTGQARRWDLKKIQLARRYAELHRVSPTVRESAIAQTATLLGPDPTDEPHPRLREAHPPEVRNAFQLERWRCASVSAAEEAQSRDPLVLWDAALALYRSDLPDKQLGPSVRRAQQRRGKPPKFRNTLAGSIPNDPGRRRRWVKDEQRRLGLG